MLISSVPISTILFSGRRLSRGRETKDRLMQIERERGRQSVMEMSLRSNHSSAGEGGHINITEFIKGRSPFLSLSLTICICPHFRLSLVLTSLTVGHPYLCPVSVFSAFLLCLWDCPCLKTSKTFQGTHQIFLFFSKLRLHLVSMNFVHLVSHPCAKEALF